MRVGIATAQARAGQTKEAAAAVEPLLKTTTDAAEINSIDPVLADTSTDLDRVHSAQQAVLDYEEKLTTDPSQWRLVES